MGNLDPILIYFRLYLKILFFTFKQVFSDFVTFIFRWPETKRSHLYTFLEFSIFLSILFFPKYKILWKIKYQKMLKEYFEYVTHFQQRVHAKHCWRSAFLQKKKTVQMTRLVWFRRSIFTFHKFESCLSLSGIIYRTRWKQIHLFLQFPIIHGNIRHRECRFVVWYMDSIWYHCWSKYTYHCHHSNSILYWATVYKNSEEHYSIAFCYNYRPKTRLFWCAHFIPVVFSRE